MKIIELSLKFIINLRHQYRQVLLSKSRGDVPGWVLVVLMTTALVTGIWSIAAPKLTTILRNSLDAMGGIRQLRKLLLGKTRGSVESFVTIIPQVFIFLIMFQLVFMQFDVMKDSNLSQGELTKIAIEGGKGNYNYYPLIGGGSLLVINQKESNKKVIAVAVDESFNN